MATLSPVASRTWAYPPSPTPEECTGLPEQPQAGHAPTIIGASEEIRSICALIPKVARSRCPVLITGESGTGKGLVARQIHALSPSSQEPFVSVNCASLPATLIESELFGHCRGAFTGATHGRSGLLTSAGHGTLFLDEIGDLPLDLQPKLLQVLEENALRPLGTNSLVPFRARVIAASNHDLGAALRQGTFRGDLYYRLNVLNIKTPPLREHVEDIPCLVEVFLRREAQSQGRAIRVSREALDCLMVHDWPGNVRELQNVLRRAVALGEDAEIRVADLPPQIALATRAPAAVPRSGYLRELERKAIRDLLQLTAGDMVRAARMLGIGKTTIYRKVKEYGLTECRPGRPRSAPAH